VKRVAKKSNIGCFSIAGFIKTNAAPHIIATEISAGAAIRGVFFILKSS
jgi:hypothetical protein